MGVGLATDKLLDRNIEQAAKRRLHSAAVDTLRDVHQTFILRRIVGHAGRGQRAPIRRRGRVPVKRRRKKAKKIPDIFT